MVAKIITGKNIRGLLLYNENKVEANKAELIMASRFGGDIEQLSFKNKLTRFENLTMLNSRVKTNALHIMLNFDTSEKIGTAKLQQIAAAYMDKIGFGDQPYLIYRHKDASHDHLHIVTTNMQADGKRIDLHNIGRLLSEPARKELEMEYGLVKAEGKGLKEALGIKPIDIEKAVYGKTPTKRAITNIVSQVTNTYKFSSVAELNAVLKQFNVVADRGREDTLMFEKKGLLYSILDKEGNKIGIPFKASSLNGKPTLKNLEEKFERNKEKRKPYKDDLKKRIDKVFRGYTTITKPTFLQELQKQNIHAVFRQNEQGFIYGLTFIDNKNRTVFNGSDLGKEYSAKAITERLALSDQLKTYLKPQQQTRYLKKTEPDTSYLRAPEPVKFLEALFDKPDYEPSVNGPRKRKRKKRKGISQDNQLTL
ncbi:relaxase/mobilization nuclease domain-containing protein [Mucilaginibacter sp. ZT4R22]|uniref:Relaxase/mobilization nuclease domain-containing protein n=1 Tax=Mucilaginibacter pankratovii TaxID=2772110 RepID=A0ABR7WWE4_9SPHI|nr:relaxase/mobilization nuclease domain-containing protein [Mucilaginibacter pankratovii]MBD1366600.1 relaxase/mobilization nuclease domain-containing protein [Mucilaginibacter pankratovii]